MRKAFEAQAHVHGMGSTGSLFPPPPLSLSVCVCLCACVRVCVHTLVTCGLTLNATSRVHPVAFISSITFSEGGSICSTHHHTQRTMQGIATQNQ